MSIRSRAREAAKRRVGISAVMQPHAGDRHPRARLLGGAHLLEVLGAELLVGAERAGHVELEPLLLLDVLARPIPGQRLAQAAGQLGRGRRIGRPERRHHHRQHLVEEGRVFPEQVERLVEDVVLLGAATRGCVQRPVQHLRPLDAGGEHRARGQDHAGPARPACRPHAAGARTAGCSPRYARRRRWPRSGSAAAGRERMPERRSRARRLPRLALDLLDQARGLAALDAGDVVLVLEQCAERRIDLLADRAPRSRARPAPAPS